MQAHFNKNQTVSKVQMSNRQFNSFSGDTLPCAAGFVCLGGSDVATPTDGVIGYPCPVGHYCPEASVIEQPCNKGSYAPATAMSEFFVRGVFILLNVKEKTTGCLLT